MLNGLDLFSGIGGLSYALADWVKPVAYCEIEKYARAVLLSRMSKGQLPIAPIWDDVKTLHAGMLPSVDIIYGGFPCQDVSFAGLRKGMEGKRTILYLEAVRLVRECRPKFVFFENVPGIRKYVPSVRGELEAIGYNCRDGFLAASEVGAPQIRNRWWLLAHNSSPRIQSGLSSRTETRISTPRIIPQDEIENSFRKEDEPECLLDRVANGVSFRVDRIRGLGNAVVPLQAREAFKKLMGL
jgi:DNA (cytosine-5)-methyltransferase 1